MKNTARLPRDRFLLFHCPRVHRCKLSIHDSEFQVRKLRRPFFFLLSRLSRSSCNRKCTHARRAHHRRGETFPIIRLVRVCLIYVYVSLRVFSLRATYTHIYARLRDEEQEAIDFCTTINVETWFPIKVKKEERDLSTYASNSWYSLIKPYSFAFRQCVVPPQYFQIISTLNTRP